MKSTARPRSILHLDLHPFFVSVERGLDPSLRGRPVVVGGHRDGSGIVAAASAEARERGVRTGQPVALARRLCPEGVFRPGDFETYARFSDDVTGVLLCASRRVERPSADEAYVDLTREAGYGPSPVAAAEAIRDEIQRRLGLDVSLGLASSRLAARVASASARPRGLLVVLPGYEASFLAKKSLCLLTDLPPHVQAALERSGLDTLGKIAAASDDTLAAVLGSVAASRLKDVLAPGEEPIPVSAPPTWIQEEATIRDRRSDRGALLTIVEGLAERAWRRLRPFGLCAGTVTVEVRRGGAAARRDEDFEPGISDEETARSVSRALAEPLVEPAAAVRGVQVRLSGLAHPGSQAPLFPRAPGVGRRP